MNIASAYSGSCWEQSLLVIFVINIVGISLSQSSVHPLVSLHLYCLGCAETQIHTAWRVCLFDFKDKVSEQNGKYPLRTADVKWHIEKVKANLFVACFPREW